MEGSVLVQLATAAPPVTKEIDFIELMGQSSGIIIVVMLALGAFSLISWYVIGYKGWFLFKAKRESQDFIETFWQSKRLDAIYQASEAMQRSPVSQVFRAGYVELSKIKSGEEQATMGAQLGGLENIERALRKAANNEITTLESMLTFLATTASTAPFLGLFGTVLGIMRAMVNIDQDVTLAVVAPGIAEALVTTAVGLMAAIPAVMAYNFFTARIRVLSAEMDSFSADFLNIVKRHFLK